MIDRQRLLAELAPLLRRIGPSNPHRAELNRRRALKRKNLQRVIRRNAEAMAARIMVLYDRQLTLEL